MSYIDPTAPKADCPGCGLPIFPGEGYVIVDGDAVHTVCAPDYDDGGEDTPIEGMDGWLA